MRLRKGVPREVDWLLYMLATAAEFGSGTLCPAITGVNSIIVPLAPRSWLRFCHCTCHTRAISRISLGLSSRPYPNQESFLSTLHVSTFYTGICSKNENRKHRSLVILSIFQSAGNDETHVFHSTSWLCK